MGSSDTLEVRGVRCLRSCQLWDAIETGSLGRAYRSRAGRRGREVALSAPAADGYGTAESATVRLPGGGRAAGGVGVGRMQRVVSNARTYQKAAAVCALKPVRRGRRQQAERVLGGGERSEKGWMGGWPGRKIWPKSDGGDVDEGMEEVWWWWWWL